MRRLALTNIDRLCCLAVPHRAWRVWFEACQLRTVEMISLPCMTDKISLKYWTRIGYSHLFVSSSKCCEASWPNAEVKKCGSEVRVDGFSMVRASLLALCPGRTRFLIASFVVILRVKTTYLRRNIKMAGTALKRLMAEYKRKFNSKYANYELLFSTLTELYQHMLTVWISTNVSKTHQQNSQISLLFLSLVVSNCYIYIFSELTLNPPEGIVAGNN